MVKEVYFPNQHCCVHPSIKGKDFELIKDGDEAFISTDGNLTNIAFK